MSLSSALSNLKSEIEKAYNDSAEKGKSGGTENILDFLSLKLGNSIDKFILQALVETDVLVDNIDTGSAGLNAAPVPGKGVGKVSSTDPSPMIDSIFKAFVKVVENGSKDDASPDKINKELGLDLSKAVLQFSKTVEVTNEIELQPFQSVGLPPITPAAINKGESGVGKGSGGNSKGLTGLSGSPAAKLAKNIEDAYNSSVKQGSSDSASTPEINKTLGNLIGQAVHDFFVSCVVKTDVTTDGGTGEIAPTSMMPAGTAMVPTAPPPLTLSGTGKGTGKIS